MSKLTPRMEIAMYVYCERSRNNTETPSVSAAVATANEIIKQCAQAEPDQKTTSETDQKSTPPPVHVLTRLVNQIDLANCLLDKLGHNFKNNQAYLDARKFLGLS